VGVPANYRHMEGFGVHTFLLLNASGKETLVKFHWKPACGALRARVGACARVWCVVCVFWGQGGRGGW
jgi:catalase